MCVGVVKLYVITWMPGYSRMEDKRTHPDHPSTSENLPSSGSRYLTKLMITKLAKAPFDLNSHHMHLASNTLQFPRGNLVCSIFSCVYLVTFFFSFHFGRKVAWKVGKK